MTVDMNRKSRRAKETFWFLVQLREVHSSAVSPVSAACPNY